LIVITNPEALDHIVIAPDSATITAGDSQAYTAEAFDQYNNSLGNVTGNTTFSITAGAGGSWADNVYTSEYAGNWTVTGTYEGKSGNATLTVNTGVLNHFNFDTISNQTAGAPFAVTIKAVDEWDNVVSTYTGTASLSDLSGSIAPLSTGNFTAGIWTGNVTITVPYTDDAITASDSPIIGTSNAFNVMIPEGMGVIYGYKFNDLNTNRIWDAGEPGIAGVTIKVGEGNQTTDQNGTYSFVVEPGNYTVEEVVPQGSYPTTPFRVIVAGVEADHSYRVDFGNAEIPEGMSAIYGMKFGDTNANGELDTNEAGIEGVTINLSNGNSTVTDGNGTYSFVVEPGNYTVQEVVPTGWRATTPTQVSLTVSQGQSQEVDFGNRENHDPVAVDDAYSVDENTTLNVASPGVLANDIDVDGDTLSVGVSSHAQHGTLTVNTNGSFVYIPTTNYSGTDSFTYEAWDGNLDSNNVAVVTITVNYVPTPPPPPPFVISVIVTPGNATVSISGTQQFTAMANYSDGSSGDVTSLATWSSGSSSVATVSAGLATAVAEGNTSITAVYGEKSGSATLNVIAGYPVSSIIVTPQSASIAVGQSQQFTATATYENGSSADVTVESIWASGNTTVATISAGNATGVGVGTSDITASLGNVTSEPAILNVGPAIVTSVIVTPEGGSVRVGGMQQLTATAKYSDGSTVDVTNQVTWSSSDEGIASVDDVGLATGKVVGDIEVTATLGTVSGSTTLTVYSPTLLSILVTPESASTPVNGTQQFTATGVYSDNSTLDVTASASWTSSDANVATIDGGLATGKGVGSTNIVASLGNVTSNTASLSVTAAVPWWLIGGIIGGLLALGLILFFLLRRRRREEPETA
jgi:hypothetical protein